MNQTTEFRKYFNADVDTTIERFLSGIDVAFDVSDIGLDLLDFEEILSEV